ncbi:tRNA dihydrouridine synthase [Nanoarchaeota archaeon]
MIKLGNLKIKNQFMLAPMSLYSDAALIKLCYDYGCSYAFTELLPTAAFIRKLGHLLPKIDTKCNIGIQFVTNDVDELKESIRMVNEHEFYPNLKNVKSIDLNLGCPKTSTTKFNIGSALLNQPKIVRSLFKTMKKYSKLPVSAKIRLGISERHKKKKQYIDVAKIAKEEGLDFITIHGRTAQQQYTGKVDIDSIKEVAEKVDIPVVGNGNIVDIKSAGDMLSFCDAIMIGRFVVKDPFFFKQLDYWFNKKKEWKPDLNKEKLRCIKKYLSYAKKIRISQNSIRVHVQHMLRGLVGQKETIRQVNKAKNISSVLSIVKQRLP